VERFFGLLGWTEDLKALMGSNEYTEESWQKGLMMLLIWYVHGQCGHQMTGGH
jgi:hypothetical protein